jgi:hypothetical protein
MLLEDFMVRIKMRRPRRPRVLNLSSHADHCDVCIDCQRAMAEDAEHDRPGHVFSIQHGKIVYLEDAIIETRLGRKLKPTETVLHKDGDPKNNVPENLELVSIETLETE